VAAQSREPDGAQLGLAGTGVVDYVEADRVELDVVADEEGLEGFERAVRGGAVGESGSRSG